MCVHKLIDTCPETETPQMMNNTWLHHVHVKCMFVDCQRIYQQTEAFYKYCEHHRCSALKCNEPRDSLTHMQTLIQVCAIHRNDIHCRAIDAETGEFCQSIVHMTATGEPGQFGDDRWCIAHFCTICRKGISEPCQNHSILDLMVELNREEWAKKRAIAMQIPK